MKSYKIENIFLRASINGQPIPGSWKNNTPNSDFKNIVGKNIGTIVTFNKQRLSRKFISEWVNGMEENIIAELTKEYNLIGDIRVFDFYIEWKKISDEKPVL
jgi:hypothetical protein